MFNLKQAAQTLIYLEESGLDDYEKLEREAHQAAKKFFDKLNCKNLPTIAQLKVEYATLLADKKKLYATYKAVKEKTRKLSMARENVTRLLHPAPQRTNRTNER